MHISIHQYGLLSCKPNIYLAKHIPFPPCRELQEETRIPWSQQESSEDVHHLDDSSFSQFIRENDETLVYFYSSSNITALMIVRNWSYKRIAITLFYLDCKSCVDIQKVYAEAATFVEEENPGSSLAAVNIGKGLDWYFVRSQYWKLECSCHRVDKSHWL